LKKTFNFLKYKSIALGLSLALLIIFLIGTYLKQGFNLGIDFVGGTKIIAKFEETNDEQKIRQALDKFNPMVQQLGEASKNEFIISTKLATAPQPIPPLKQETNEQKKSELDPKESTNSKNKDGQMAKDEKKEKETEKEAASEIASSKKEVNSAELEEIKNILITSFKQVSFLSIENVGPAIGDFLKKSALKLFFIAIILMTIYLTFRFEFKYSVGAMIALLHDILLSTLFCGALGIEINIPVIAAMLTIFGYSVNDTIVIFDRVRENTQHAKTTLLETINRSISQSFNRTLLTSLTTLFTVLALYLIGGEVLNQFALVLLFGIFIGTYSSIYVASPVLILWEKFRSKR